MRGSVFRLGDAQDALFCIMQGQAKSTTKDGTLRIQYHRGDLFGTQAILQPVAAGGAQDYFHSYPNQSLTHVFWPTRGYESHPRHRQNRQVTVSHRKVGEPRANVIAKLLVEAFARGCSKTEVVALRNAELCKSK